MMRTVLIEGILLLILSLTGMAEGFRLVIYKDPYTLYDPLGPGLYIITIGIGLMALGVVHLIVNYRKPSIMEKVPVDRKMKIRMMSTVTACAIYILLINIIGYLLATIIFFFLELRVEGIKSWPLVVVLSLVLSVLYYLVFVQCCSMVFPRGIVFR
jgi:putative tricarboxylic transport membrane protein